MIPSYTISLISVTITTGTPVHCIFTEEFHIAFTHDSSDDLFNEGQTLIICISDLYDLHKRVSLIKFLTVSGIVGERKRFYPDHFTAGEGSSLFPKGRRYKKG